MSERIIRPPSAIRPPTQNRTPRAMLMSANSLKKMPPAATVSMMRRDWSVRSVAHSVACSEAVSGAFSGVDVQSGTAYPIGDDASVELSKYSCSGAVTARPRRERMKAGVTAASGSPPVVKKRSPTEITLRNSCDWAPQTAEQKAENRVVHGEVGDGR